MCQNIRLCSSRFTVVEAHLHVTASFRKSVARLVCNSQSFELVLQHSAPRLWSWQHLGQHPTSADFLFIVMTSIVLILPSSFTMYLLTRVMGIAEPIWTVNMVEQELLKL